jgi:HD-GYP domain-containing protein (c-di-GMP phosphodiesterase class II)
MSEKSVLVSLSKVLIQSSGKSANKILIDVIKEENVPVLCIKKSSKSKKFILFKTLYDINEAFWKQASGWEYYLTEEFLNKIKEKVIARTGSWIDDIPDIEKKAEKNTKPPPPKAEDEELEELEEVQVGYGSDYKTFASMSTAEKVDYLNKNKIRLDELIALKNKDTEVVTEVLVDTAKDAALINHTALVDAIHLADKKAKKLTQDLVDSTHEMVKSSVQLLTADIFNNELLNTLVKKSNGTIVQHMTRVYIQGIAFLSYYNTLVSTSSAIQKLRISFQTKYRDFYHKLLPHVDIEDLSLERVFYGGMRAIHPDLYFKWAVGFLIHDVGKASAIEYHEGESTYDRNIVIDHVKQGYKSVLSKTNYPMEASLIIGYHHEYYGDPAGYGYFRAYLQQYKKQNQEAKQDYCITFDLEPILDYQVLAYFPAKILEIIDVYDSVTDPHRVYRKALTPDEALIMMREEFIEKYNKIDIILFDIFELFIREQQKRQQ